MNNEQAPSAKEIIERNTNPEFDTVESLRAKVKVIMRMLGEACDEIERLKAPSATVDEIVQTSAEVNQYRPWDSMGISETAYWQKRYLEVSKELQALHSQQPTVEVDAIVKQIEEDCVKIDEANGNCFDDKRVKQIIQEALRGSYSREDMIAFGRSLETGGVMVRSHYEEQLDQFTAQRNKGE